MEYIEGMHMFIMTTDGDAHKSVPLQTLFKVGCKKCKIIK